MAEERQWTMKPHASSGCQQPEVQTAPTIIPGDEFARLVDDLVAAFARQLLSRVGLRTIRS
jgi:hypothetical protein